MQVRIGTAFAVALLVGLTFLPFHAHGQSQEPTALELAQLPRFCYAQFKVPNATGDEFRIRDCGYAANHYCYGLMYIIRAKAAVSNKRTRMGLLGSAAVNIDQTEQAIKDYPQCSIREHVAASKKQVLDLKKIYGGQPAGAK